MPQRLSDDDISALRQIAPNAAFFTAIDVQQQVPLPLTPLEVLNDMEDVNGFDVIDALGSNLTNQSIDRLCKLTKSQSKSMLWKKHRKGRVTASVMHKVLRIKDTTNRKNIVNEILGLNPPISTPAIKYGLKNEEVAWKSYLKYQSEFHNNVTCTTPGLMLNAIYPHLGSSPDGIVTCDCCGKGCLEIKCLYKYENGLPGPLLPDNPKYKEGPFTTQDSTYPIDADFQVKKSHKFYTQVQGHMMICDVQYCDLYLWSKSRSVAIRVPRDQEFIDEMNKKLTHEYLTYVVPAMMSSDD